MKKTEEKAVTLVALVITIVLLLILVSIGVNSGISTLEFSKFYQFENELKILQNKVNELNENDEKDIGQNLTNEQEQVLENSIISDIIYKEKTEEEKTLIKAGFKYCNREYIKNNLNLEGIKRGYLINVEYRYIIYPNGLIYKDTTYYMLNQIEDGYYNVEYNDKNSKTGDFDVNYVQENDRFKIQITNVEYDGYINNWKVKYKLSGSSYWETSDELSFYINEPGKYTFNVQHGNEVDLGTEEVDIFKSSNTADGSWNGYVNTPNLKNTGLIPVYWDETRSEWIELTSESTQEQWDNWYDYASNTGTSNNNSHWANAITKGEDAKGNKIITGYWVWIPRYAYQIESELGNGGENVSGTISIKFLQGTTNKDEEGTDRDGTYSIDETNKKMNDYVVHPAFKDGRTTQYTNGEWNKEIPGFWVAKYEAGFQECTQTINNGTVTEPTIDISKIVYSDESFTSINTNYITNAISQDLTEESYASQKISYPVFKPLTYSYNVISISDMYTISRKLEDAEDFYNLSNIDSHMLKNSEWGACVYLTHSSYGRKKIQITKNTKNLNNKDSKNIYAVTGYEGTTANGYSASSTGNITGVFDLNGGITEFLAGYITNPNGNDSRSNYGQAFATSTISTKYATIYPYSSSDDTNTGNYNEYVKLKTTRYGDAILETSNSGSNSKSWNENYSHYPTNLNTFFYRGGAYNISVLSRIF